MVTRNGDVPWFSYGFAVVAGLIVLPFTFLLTSLLAELLDVGPEGFASVFPPALVVSYAILGSAFGFVWPESTWRWGVWLSAAPVCFVSFFGLSAPFYVGWVALTLLPACAGAYAAARLHFKYIGVS